MKQKFVRYRFIRYWFRLFDRPWSDTNIPCKHFPCLQDVFKTPSKHVFKTYSRHAFKMSSRPPQHNNFSFYKMLSKHIWRRLQDVFEDEKLLCSRCVEDFFKKCLEDVLKINKCLLGKSLSWLIVNHFFNSWVIQLLSHYVSQKNNWWIDNLFIGSISQPVKQTVRLMVYTVIVSVNAEKGIETYL